MDKKNQKERRVKKRRQAEEALRANEVRHRAILEWSLDAIISVDREGRIIEFNKAAETMFGHASKDVIGKEMTTLIIPPALRERHRAGWARHLATGTTSIICKRIEITAMRASGAEFPIELIVTRFGPEGDPTFTAFIRDITERKRAEAALRNSEAQFRAIFEVASVGIVQVDPRNGQIIRYNERYREITGYADAELCAMKFPELTHPDDRQRDWEIFCSAARNKTQSYQNEKRYIRKNGSIVWVRLNASFIRDNDGQPIRTVAVCEDITARKRAEEELQEMHLALINAMPGIATLNSEGLYERVNEAYAQMVGYGPSDLIGKDWAPTVAPDDMKAALEAYQRMLSEGNGEFEARAVRKEGSVFYKHVLMAKRTAKDGTFLGHHCFMRDITARKQTEDESARLLKEVQDGHERLQHLSRRMLEVQEEERRRLARELHDQTGQSLTSLLIGLRTLEEASTLEAMRAQARNLRKITAQALDEVKRLAIGLRPSLLDDLGLEAALKRLAKESAKTYGVSVDLHVKGLTNHRLSPPVETGLYRLAQEALTNTGRHAAAQTVSILLTCSESSVKLIVEDDGRGFNVEKTLSLPGSSNHLGLLGMRERVALLNGTLSVESTPGSGTTIYAQMPWEARPS